VLRGEVLCLLSFVFVCVSSYFFKSLIDSLIKKYQIGRVKVYVPGGTIVYSIPVWGLPRRGWSDLENRQTDHYRNSLTNNFKTTVA
jgi:hypothetical protein